MTTTQKTSRNASQAEWTALAEKSRDPAAFLRGEIRCFEDALGERRLLPPDARIERTAPTRPQHEYPIDLPPADATPSTPSTDAAVDVAAALAESAVSADDAGMRAVEDAMRTMSAVTAPSRPVTPTVASGRSAGDAALDEIERLAQPTRKSADAAATDGSDDIFQEAQRLGGVR